MLATLNRSYWEILCYLIKIEIQLVGWQVVGQTDICSGGHGVLGIL